MRVNVPHSAQTLNSLFRQTTRWPSKLCIIGLLCRTYAVNSSPPSAAYMRQWMKSAVVQIMVSDLTNIGSDNSLSPTRRQATIETNACWLLIWPFGTNFSELLIMIKHDDVIKWKHFPRNWPFVREIHRSPVNFPHKGQWRGALMFSLIYAWINDWVNNREAGDLRRQHGHYDVIVMKYHLRNGDLCPGEDELKGQLWGAWFHGTTSSPVAHICVTRLARLKFMCSVKFSCSGPCMCETKPITVAADALTSEGTNDRSN